MKISINEPCHQNWDKMTPNDKGAFCLSCKKNVIDFSNKTITEVKDFFMELPSTKNVCGRFSETQLNEISFDDFINDFMSWKFMKRAAVICFMILGTTLLNSCSNKPEEEHLMGMIAPDTTIKEQCIKDTLKNDTTAITMGQATVNQLRKSHVMGGPKVIKDTVKTATYIKGDVGVREKKK